jgi:Flp pilus assembly protein TadG
MNAYSLRPTSRRGPGRQRGSAAIAVALLLSMVFAIGAFALDIGHVLLTRNELQNAADAAALSGAGALFSGTPQPNWAGAEAKAATTAGLNKSGPISLVDSMVEAGYWNIAGSPAGIQSINIVPGPNDVPAVKVTIGRDENHNGGKLVLSFGGFVGLKETAVSATAVALVSGPGAVPVGALFPIAITKCLYDKYWDSAKMQPKIDPVTKKPYTFKIGSSYHYDVCDSGQWTSFQDDDNNVPTIRNLMENGNPTPLAIGDKTWIQPGTQNTVFDEVPVNRDVLIPVVVDLDTHSYQPVVAFAAFHIDVGVGGSDKYIEGHFVTNVPVPAGASGVGPYYGAFIPARLAE